MQIEKILNPVDGSNHSLHACQYAMELAKTFNAQIILLHCHRSFPVKLREDYFQDAVNLIQKESATLVKPFEDILVHGHVDYDVRLLQGRASDMICEVARIENADVIIMGSRGVTDLKGFLLGSVAHKVLHKSQCPVFIIK
ncbi:MAG: universal stress protein [Desulfobacteraceae bacterium]|nr:universal stress protein [Desulfobacteraceae bacterium]